MLVLQVLLLLLALLWVMILGFHWLLRLVVLVVLLHMVTFWWVLHEQLLNLLAPWLLKLIVLVCSCLLLTDVALSIGVQHVVLHLLLDNVGVGAFEHS